MKQLTQLQRLWRYIDKNGPNGCWLWTGAVNSWGYGAANLNGKRMQAVHRFMYDMFKGLPHPQAWCLHRCDTPRCVNPEHLYIGNAQDNVNDMFVRGRDRSRGERNFHARLTEAQVLEILANPPIVCRGRAGKSTVRQYAERYGVSGGAIRAILRGTTWKHIVRTTSTETARQSTSRDIPNGQ